MLTGDPRKFTTPAAPATASLVSSFLSYPCGFDAAVRAAKSARPHEGVWSQTDGDGRRVVHTIWAGSLTATGVQTKEA